MSGYQSGGNSSDEEEVDANTLPTATRKALIVRSQWLSLKDRLREFTLDLRVENTHLIDFFTRADEANTGTLDIDDVMTILSTLQFPFLSDEIIDDLVEQVRGCLARGAKDEGGARSDEALCIPRRRSSLVANTTLTL